ncbi:hypothetical protein [Devosia beringensis]|uniref:hypothetical protein n=1 Tax=Devosia beringensis TaxID=2657486 RepID=UPI00186B77AE|nr:hypothetical protein [Devosia beringensis]
MNATGKFRLRNLLVLTTLPALAIGGLLWAVAGLLPSCGATENARVTAPDQRFDLVVFSRSCGPDSGPNTQAALLPVGDPVPEDATSFVSIGADADLAPRWDGFGNIEITIPPGAEIYRQDDAVAGVAVIYR